jgi:hypothetical protein
MRDTSLRGLESRLLFGKIYAPQPSGDATDRRFPMRDIEIAKAAAAFKAAIWGLAAGLAVLILIAGGMALVAPRPAQATPQFAAQTHLPCARCHVNPAGGGPRNAFGKAFQENGFKLPSKKKQ